jgi:hypothetical protein
VILLQVTISPAFEYVEAWFWPVMTIVAFGLGCITGWIVRRG